MQKNDLAAQIWDILVKAAKEQDLLFLEELAAQFNITDSELVAIFQQIDAFCEKDDNMSLTFCVRTKSFIDGLIKMGHKGSNLMGQEYFAYSMFGNWTTENNPFR